MARGKQAVRSANRRVDAVNSHVDRLTDRLADAKAKADRYEKDAHRVPHLLAENARLKAQIEANVYSEVERLKEQVETLREEHETAIIHVANREEQFRRIVKRLHEMANAGTPGGTEGWTFVLNLMTDHTGVIIDLENDSAKKLPEVARARIAQARRQITQSTASRIYKKIESGEQALEGPAPLAALDDELVTS